MPFVKYESLTLEQIQKLTGHDTLDGVRMGLKRAGIVANGLTIGTRAWPPKKIYPADQVWNAFAIRIIEHAQTDPDVKDFCWDVFRKQITTVAYGQAANDVFADRLN